MTKQAVLTCCANAHKFTRGIPNPGFTNDGYIRGTILYCDTQRHRPNIVAAGDRLRDFLTVRLITAQLNSEGNN